MKLLGTLETPDGPARVGRCRDGVAQVEARGDAGLAYGLGWMHACDRTVQLVMTRTIAQGRLAELLTVREETERTDVFMRRLGLARGAADEVADLSAPARAWLDAYCAGINAYWASHRRPLELMLVGLHPEPWTPADSLLTLKVMSYVGLAQSQQDIEKFLVQAVRRGADRDFLRALLRPHLDGWSDALMDLLGDLEIAEPFLTRRPGPADLLPHIEASNNWVVGSERSASGACLQANDPHLEVDRLPAIWYEAALRAPGRYAAGVSMPGLPGLAMGRTPELSYGFTYGCMDMIDYYLEDCRDGQYRRGERWRPFVERVEVIWRKGREPRLEHVFENELGVLEGDPRVEGRYLLRAWSGHRTGCARTLEALHEFQAVRSVAEAQPVLARVAVSANWLVADRGVALGYQQSGLLPERPHSGLYPLPAWDEATHWRGLVPAEELARRDDEGRGWIATTNDPQPETPGRTCINLCNGDYRAARIEELLAGSERLTTRDLKRFQLDVVSLQARRWLEFLDPHLPLGPESERLRAWGGRYATELEEPVWFEALYTRLMEAAFGERFGEGVWDFVIRESGLLNDMHVHLDRLFLEEGERWVAGGDPEGLAREVAAEVLAEPPAGTWGEVNAVRMENIFFAGRLPGVLGFDIGPVPIQGGRATLSQGRVYTSHGRSTSFVPSWRFVTDLAEDACETALPGGPSGRRGSRYYSSGLAGWLGGEYRRWPLAGLPEDE